jgi:hypothetical protein
MRKSITVERTRAAESNVQQKAGPGQAAVGALLPPRRRPATAAAHDGGDLSHHTNGAGAEAARPGQEAIMENTVPTQHPAVVLRSHYTLVRALLAVAMIAVVGLSAAVVILATRDDRDTIAGGAAQATTPAPSGDIRYDGGPEEGTRGALSPVRPAPAAGVRYDGGPEEGTRGAPSGRWWGPAPLHVVSERAREPAGRQPLRRRSRGGH